MDVVIIATQVWQAETFVLQDGTEVTIKPLNIKRLRLFMQIISQLGETEKTVGKEKVALSVEEREEKFLQTIFEAALIPIAQADKELSENKDKLEEILDVPTIHKILEVAGNVKLNTENLV